MSRLRMRKIIMISLLAGLLSGCNFVHKMDIEQGNVFNDEMVNQLHRGMTKSEVKEIMGTPTLLNTFDDNRVNYVYTYQPGGHPRCVKQVTLVFANGRLRDIIRNNYTDPY